MKWLSVLLVMQLIRIHTDECVHLAQCRLSPEGFDSEEAGSCTTTDSYNRVQKRSPLGKRIKQAYITDRKGASIQLLSKAGPTLLLALLRCINPCLNKPHRVLAKTPQLTGERQVKV